MQELIHTLTWAALPLILAITVHEAAHAYTANFFGDATAKYRGRMTLNPWVHIDWIGTVLVPLMGLMIGGFLMGWAKPVPVVFERLKPRKQGAFWTVAAGPLSNLGMALMWWGVYAVSGSVQHEWIDGVSKMSRFGIQINMMLCIFNLFPLLPLDGGRIACLYAPRTWRERLEQLEPYGFWIVLALVMTGIMQWWFTPFMIMASLVGIPT